ncbi:MAG: phage head closure protein [Sedimentisphaerales bacterium]|nr:phage head closure protein [Sedimentisphaerales bacterium]
MRHRVELQQFAESQDGYGEMVREYTTYATVWAEIKPLQGKELEHAQQISAETDFQIRIRYNPAVASEHRVVFGNRVFEITAVKNTEERNEELVLMCKEIS